MTVALPGRRDRPNAACAAVPRPQTGKLLNVTATGHTFLGCAGYSADNGVGHKNSSLTSVSKLDEIRKWKGQKR